jgi:hypothetical protein
MLYLGNQMLPIGELPSVSMPRYANDSKLGQMWICLGPMFIIRHQFS